MTSENLTHEQFGKQQDILIKQLNKQYPSQPQWACKLIYNLAQEYCATARLNQHRKNPTQFKSLNRKDQDSLCEVGHVNELKRNSNAENWEEPAPPSIEQEGYKGWWVD